MESLSTVFRRALLNASKASNLPTIKDETQVVVVLFYGNDSPLKLVNQELIDIALKDCKSARARVADLALFSPNETLDDISTQVLVYLFVPYVSAEIESRARAIERDERLERMREAEVCPGLSFLRLTLSSQRIYTFYSSGSKVSPSLCQT